MATFDKPFDIGALTQALLVEEQGSFRLAALALNVRPSVVSRRIRSLEDEIGVALFNRSSRGVQATVAGQRILTRGRTILTEIDGLKRMAQLNGRGQEGRLRLGIVASIAAGFSRELLQAFSIDQPNVELDVVEGSSKDGAAAVRQLTMDFVIATGVPSAPGCAVEALWNERIFVALPHDHRFAARGELAWDELAQERFIVSRGDPGPEIEDYIIRGLADLGRHPDVVQLSVQRETLMGLVGLKQGLSLVGAAEAGVTYLGVIFRPLDHELLPFSIIWSQQNDNPALRRF